MAQGDGNVTEEYFEASSLPRIFSEMGNATIGGLDVETDGETYLPKITFTTNASNLVYGLYRRAEGEDEPIQLSEFVYRSGITSYLDHTAEGGVGYTYHISSYQKGQEGSPTFTSIKIFHLAGTAPRSAEPEEKIPPSSEENQEGSGESQPRATPTATPSPSAKKGSGGTMRHKIIPLGGQEG